MRIGIFLVLAAVLALGASGVSASNVPQRDRAEGDSYWIDPTTGQGGVKYESQGSGSGKVRRQGERCDEDDAACSRGSGRR